MRIPQPLRTAVRRVFNLCGLDISFIPKSSPGLYQPVNTLATYSPWNEDRAFLDTFQQIKKHTMLDILRAYELWMLVEQSAKLHGAILEVGCWRGGSGALVGRRARASGIDDPIILCDTFQGIVKAGREDPMYDGGELADASADVVREIVHGKFQLENVQILEGSFPEDCSHLVQSTSFRFCHIDVDVYQSAKDSLLWVWPKMVNGGIVVFDDYGFPHCEGVAKFVNEFAGEQDLIFVHNINGHAIFMKHA